MSELMGFKYTVSTFMQDIDHDIINNRKNHYTYIILSKEDGKYYIDKFSEGSIHRYDITGKTDEFCDAVERIGIKDWDRKVFPEIMEFFPRPPQWQLEVRTDKTAMTCMGDCGCAYPHGWDEFMAAFEKMCGEEIDL